MDIISITWNSIYHMFTPEETKQILKSPNMANTQENFAKSILENKLFHALFVVKKGIASKATVTRVFSGHKHASHRFEAAKDYILTPNPTNGELYKYGEADYWKVTVSNWRKALNILSNNFPDFRDTIKDKILSLLIEEIDNHKDSLDLKNYVQNLMKISLEEALTFLTFVASTLPYWNNQGELKNVSLYYLIKNPAADETYITGMKDYTSLIRKNTKLAEEYLEIAREKFAASTEDPCAAKECCEYCFNITHLRPLVHRPILGEAFYMIFKCSNAGEFKLPKGTSPIQYLEQSNTYGYKEAAKDWKRLHPTSITYLTEPSTSSSCGTCIFNTENDRTLLLEKTRPTGWSVCNLGSNKKSEISLLTVAGKKLRYFLLDDNYQVNLQDTLTILHVIKSKAEKKCYDVEIFLRGEEDILSPLIDTALSHMDDTIIPVHILDDDKCMAQRLLSFHPLYYPLCSLPEKSSCTLNFVVLGDSRCAEWLIREAFWLMSFRNKEISTKITLLSPHSNLLKSRINASCPGMIDGDNGIGDIEGISFAKIYQPEPFELDSYALQEELRTLFSRPDEYFYFAVATNSDEKNLSYAIRLREWMIREYIRQNKTAQLDQLPVIAYQCSEPDTAHISKNMVVQMEDLGNRWYNNYALIPFGSYSERYTWDEVDGGILEKMARCIHLQYNGIPFHPEDWNNQTQTINEAKKQAMASYYNRQYNRDSSFAVAMGMTYRLFQCKYKSHSSYNPTMPPHWSILDDTVFSDPDSLETLAQRYRDEIKYNEEEEYNTLAQLEHARWVRYMCARGWLSATFEQTVTYIKAGNPQQQLYIARLHPCMCSYRDLDQLSRHLKENCNLDKNFKKIDIENVKCTPAFLQRAWLEKERELELEIEEISL